MTTIEKTIKVLEADRDLSLWLQKYYADNGEKALSERHFGEWLGFDLALTMLTDEALAEVIYKARFAKEADVVEGGNP